MSEPSLGLVHGAGEAQRKPTSGPVAAKVALSVADKTPRREVFRDPRAPACCCRPPHGPHNTIDGLAQRVGARTRNASRGTNVRRRLTAAALAACVVGPSWVRLRAGVRTVVAEWHLGDLRRALEGRGGQSRSIRGTRTGSPAPGSCAGRETSESSNSISRDWMACRRFLCLKATAVRCATAARVCTSVARDPRTSGKASSRRSFHLSKRERQAAVVTLRLPSTRKPLPGTSQRPRARRKNRPDP